MEITKDPHPILHRKLKPVEEITPEILDLISDMKAAMKKAEGVGLAANQVGVDLRIFVITPQLAEENGVPEAYINPEITEYSKDAGELEEGCLSLPGDWRRISRAKKVWLKATDPEGKKVKIKARGFLARVFQHETDHLNGLLIRNRNE